MKRPAAVSDLMAALFCGKPAEKRLEEGKIWLVWEAAVGRQIAAKAQPASFRDGVLSVVVVSAPWMQQLTFLKKGMMEKLNERIGHELVRDIYLKAGTPPPSPVTQPERKKKPQRKLAETELRWIAEQTAAVNDRELQETLASLLTKNLAETPSLRQQTS